MRSLIQKAMGDRPIRMQLEVTYKNARFSLLLIIAFTLINMIMRVSQSTSYWLFSANIPFFFVDLGMYFGGVYQNPTSGMIAAGFGKFDSGFFYGMLAIAILFVVAYFVFWLLSANGRIAWITAAVSLFALDTVFLILSTLLNAPDLPSVDLKGGVILAVASLFLVAFLLLLCYFLSSNEVIGAIVALAISALVMLFLPRLGVPQELVSILVDFALHLYALASLVMGLQARRRYLSLPADAPIYEEREN